MTFSLARRVLADLRAPEPRVLPEGWDRAAGRLLHARHLRAYKWAVPFVTGRDTLEIGTNAGYGSRILAPHARSFVGLDVSMELARRARTDTGLPVVVADGQEIPLRSESLDCVVSFQVIEHVWDVDLLLREVRRVLRTGGLLLVSSPNGPLRLFAGQIPWNDEHLREYDQASWARQLRPTFDDVEILGLFGDPGAEALERARTKQDPWSHYFRGRVGATLRKVATRLPAAFYKASAGDLPAVSEINARSHEQLLRHFFLDGSELSHALDLLAVCRKEDGAPGRTAARPEFDPSAYWRTRLGREPSLRGTGTLGLSVGWQRWMYRGKVRAYERLLRRNRVSLRGAIAIDLGCGTGFFEDHWERRGALRAHGIDMAPDLLPALRRRFPDRRYICANLAEAELSGDDVEAGTLLTAIDVLYHITDDAALASTLRHFLRLGASGATFLFTDALHEGRPAEHVRFRSLNQWKQLLQGLGWRVVDTEPVFVLNNRLFPGVGRLPVLAGAVQHLLDAPVLRAMPWLANNWAVLARRDGGPEAAR